MPDFPNDPVSATSTSKGKPALQGEGGDNDGVRGICHNAHGGVVGINDWGGDGSPGSGGNGGWFESTQGEGVRGISRNPNHGGVVGVNTAGGIAVFGNSPGNDGVQGTSNDPTHSGVAGFNLGGGIGVFGESSGNDGVQGNSQSLTHSGVAGFNQGGGIGVFGNSSGNDGVQGNSQSLTHSGVAGFNQGGGIGVFGSSNGDNGAGVVGRTRHATGFGILGFNVDDSAHAILGGHLSHNEREPVGVFGAQYNRSGYAGFFAGNVVVTGDLFKSGLYFRIDHPLDPANKYLHHASVESPDMKNVYDGVIALDANGEALVVLSSYVESLNNQFRYQLTAIGAASPNLHIVDEISNCRFKIAGGNPHGKVSWQVTGIRQDPYARHHRIPIEQEKSPDERGKYLHAVEYGMPESIGIENEMKHRLEKGPPIDTPQTSSNANIRKYIPRSKRD